MTVSGSQRPRDGSGIPGDDEESERREFARIEAALEETGMGRRFLAAHARRHRGADTALLLQAIARLEAVVTQETMRHDTARGEGHADDGADGRGTPDRPAALAGLAAIVAGLRTEIAAGCDDAGAPEPFEVRVQAGGRETSAIFAATEAMQEAAWQLRENGADEQLCDVLDRRATAIYTACAAQDRIAQASLCIARTLSLMETRIAAMIADAGSQPAAPSPPPPEQEVALAPDAAEAGLPDTAQAPAAEPRLLPQDALASAFADLDRLSIEEKIALFS